MIRSRESVIDSWLVGYLKYLEGATHLWPKESVARQFSTEAHLRYRQFRRTGDERLRWAAWSAVQISLRALEKEGRAPRRTAAAGAEEVQ